MRLARLASLYHQPRGLRRGGASLREVRQNGVFSLGSLAFGLTVSSSTGRLLLDGLCILMTGAEATDQSQLREDCLSSSTLKHVDDTRPQHSTDLAKGET